jgi:hypothetical protein
VLDDFAGAYGAEPATLWAEVLHQLRLRLRLIGPTVRGPLDDLGARGGFAVVVPRSVARGRRHRGQDLRFDEAQEFADLATVLQWMS